ncbi:MAG: hypothetical protein ACKVP0_20615 [Pirellulaceae bacterium]
MSSRLFFVVVVVLLANQAYCEDEVQEGPWLKAPVRRGVATGKDKAAREEILALIERRQDAEFRKQFKVVIPDQPSELPRDYDLLLYGKHLDWSLQRFEINVRGDKAVIELATRDIRRGEIAKDQVDSMARQLIYACMAEIQERDPEVLNDAHGRSIGSHAPYLTFEIRSKDRDFEFHFRTKAEQFFGRDVSVRSGGVAGFVEAQLHRQLHRLAADQLPVIQPAEKLNHDLIDRLKQIPNGQVENEDNSYTFRNDIAAVDALLFGKLAVEWRIKDALPELRRLKLDDFAEQLRVATMENPEPELVKLLRSKNWGLFTWSLKFAAVPPNPKYFDSLLDSLPHVADEHRADLILEVLEGAKVTLKQLAVVQAFHDSAKANSRSRIAAARFLLGQTDKVEFYRELRNIAQTERAKPDYLDPEEAAIKSVLAYSLRSGKQCDESAALTRLLLDRNPDYKYDLIRYLGQLGNSEDLPRLKSFCQKDNTYLTYAITAIAHIDPPQGFKLALEQIDLHIKSEEDPRWRVQAYLDLLFWRRDPAAIKPLEVTLAKSRDHDSEDLNWISQLEQVLQYLKSQDVKERLAIALKFDRDYFDQAWRADIGRQLIADGADAKACEVFLKPRPRLNRALE